MKLTCTRCRMTHSVTKDKPVSGSVYICQDCAERALARIQHRAPRLIYDGRGYATVIEGNTEDSVCGK